MKKDLTEIIFLLDRSGSMAGLEGDTIGGFNSFVKKQSKLGETLITTILFDDKYEILHNGIDAKKTKLTNKNYYTRGMTALLDAVGKTVNEVKARHKKGKPNKTIFVITTDGMENASKEFSYKEIKKMITDQTKKDKWEFIFMSANIDIVKESSKLGIKTSSVFKYSASSAGTKEMYEKLDLLACDIRNE